MWELDQNESWVPRNWYFWTVVLKKTLESPLDYKEIQPVNPKGNQFWIFIGRTKAEAEAPVFLPLDLKNWLLGEDPDAGKDWGQEEKGMTEDEMVRWHHWLQYFTLNDITLVWSSLDGEGNGNPLQCSCLENPRDGGAWWAAVYGVTQSRTWLKWLSSSRLRMTKFQLPEVNIFTWKSVQDRGQEAWIIPLNLL